MIEHFSFEALGEGSALFQGYLKGSEVVRPWYGGFWNEEKHIRETAGRIQGQVYPRAALVTVLKRQQEAFGAPAEALAQVEALGHPTSLAVITGQQVGLLGGPLYTWWKALTTIKTAREWAGRLGCPVVPVFWMAADDHDLAEINHLAVLDRDHALRRLTYRPGNDAVGWPAFRVPLRSEFEELWPALEEGLPESEFREEILKTAKSCYAPGRSMVTAFGAWLTRWFGSMGLVVVDPSDPALKRLATGLFLRELEDHPASRRLYDERTRALEHTGTQPQIHLPEDVLNFMWMDDQRRPLRVRQNAIEIGGRTSPFDVAEWKKKITDRPDRVSPNVLLNPLYQDTLFPALFHVLGPAETSYFAQVRPLYDHFGMTPPVLMPRHSLTVVTQRTISALEDLGITLEEALKGNEEAYRRSKRHAVPQEIEGSITRVREITLPLLKDLEEQVKLVDAGLTSLVSRAQSGLDASLKKLEEKVGASAERQNEALGRKVIHVRNLMRPYGALQERSLNVMSFLVRHGPQFTEHVAAQLPDDPSYHYVIKI